MEALLIAFIIFLSAFTQSLAGFGLALVSMAMLPGVVGLRLASPLVALVALTLQVVMLGKFWRAVNFRNVGPVILASLVGTPLGVWALGGLSEDWVLGLLGLTLALYGLYALLNIRMPALQHPAWGYGVGLLAGALGGAYNTSGPPVIIYGSCRGWQPAEFKGNLQGFFLFNSLMVAVVHAFQGNFTPQVWQAFWWTLPPMLLGFLAGLSIDRRLNPETFRKLVLVLLIGMGVRLMF